MPAPGLQAVEGGGLVAECNCLAAAVAALGKHQDGLGGGFKGSL